MRIQVYNGQSLLDVAIQYFADEQRVFELSRMNGLSICHQFMADTTLEIPNQTSQPRWVATLKQYRVNVQRLDECSPQEGYLIDETDVPTIDEMGNILVSEV